MASSIELLPPTTTRVLCDGSGLIDIWSGAEWEPAACLGCTACVYPMAHRASVDDAIAGVR